MRPEEVFVSAVRVSNPINIDSGQGIMELLATAGRAREPEGEAREAQTSTANVIETMQTAEQLFPPVVWPEGQMIKLPKGTYCGGAIELNEDYELFPFTHSFWLQFGERFPRLQPIRESLGEPVRGLSLSRLSDRHGIVHAINHYSLPYGTFVKVPSLSLVRALLSIGENAALLKKTGISSLVTASCVRQREQRQFLTVGITGGEAQMQAHGSNGTEVEQDVNAKIFFGRSRFELNSESFAVLDLQEPDKIKIVYNGMEYPGASVLLERAPFILSRSIPFKKPWGSL